MKMNPLIHRGRESKPSFLWLAFFILLLLLIGCYVGLRFGAISYSQEQIFDVLRHPLTDSKLQDVIIDIRLPRMLGAILVGAAMAIAGAMMQGITRNPIADPGLLGINTGAGLALAIASAFSSGLHYTQILLVCLVGSSISACLVFGLAYQPKKGYNQLRLILAGAMIATLCSSIGQGLTIYFKLAGSIIGWQAGGLIGVNWTMLAYIAPAILLGLVLAQVSAHQLTILSLNETVAKALGQRTLVTTIFMLFIVLLLSASSVALVGSLSFVGLIIPHFVRLFVPRNYQLSLPLTGLTGATFMLWVDIVCRSFNPPYETPLNAIIAVIGLPCFIILIRGRKKTRMTFRNQKILLLGLLLLLIVVSILSLSIGDNKSSILDVLQSLTGQANGGTRLIILQIRLPRILACLLGGGSLALSGLLLQTLTRNPLADSGILGINAGAGMVIALFISYGLMETNASVYAMPFLAMLGGFVTILVVYLIARNRSASISPVRLIITGVGISTMLSSLMVSIVGNIDRYKVEYMVNWLSGRVSGGDWGKISLLGPLLILLWLVTASRYKSLNILGLNEQTAMALGLNIQKERIITLLLATSLASISLILVGNITFVGLVAGHIARRLVSSKHQFSIPAALLIGMIVLVIADTLGRVLLVGTGIPTGIIVSLVGAPYFLYLMYQEK